MVESACGMVGWKHYVKTDPRLRLGTTVALGALIVPQRTTALRPNLATLEKLLLLGLAVDGGRLQGEEHNFLAGDGTNIVVQA